MLWMKVKPKFYLQLQQLVGAYSRDWRQATDVQRTAKLADSSSGSGKGATIRQEERKASPETRHTAVFTLGLGNTSNPPLGDKEISLPQSPWAYSERKRWILTSGGSKSSTQCAHLTKKVCKQKSLLPTGGLQEHQEENLGNLQAKCHITSSRTRGHGNWPWKKRTREKERHYCRGSPKERVTLGDPASECPGAWGSWGLKGILQELWLCWQQGAEQANSKS